MIATAGVPETEMASVPIRAKNHWVATAEEWDAQKEQILHLYIELNKPLRQVADIMRQKHGFCASPKQYKHRFKVWGMRKNLTRNERDDVWLKAARGQAAQLPLVKGRQLGSQRLKNFIANRAEVRIVQPGLPESLKLAESAMRATVIYSEDWVKHMAIVKDDLAGVRTRGWWVDITSAATRIKDQPDSPAGFAMLNDCCSRFQSVLRYWDSNLVQCTYFALLSLANAGEEVARLFIKFAAELCAIELGPSHPFTMLWVSIHAMGISEARQAEVPILTAYFNIVLGNIDMGHPMWLTSKYFLGSFLYRAGAVDASTVLEMFASSLGQLSEHCAAGGKYARYWATWSNSLSTLTSEVDTTLGPHHDALLSICHVEEWDKNYQFTLDNIEIDVTQAFGATGEFVDRGTNAELFYRRSLDLALERKSRGDPRILKAYEDLESFYRRHSQFEAADAVRIESQNHRNSSDIQPSTRAKSHNGKGVKLEGTSDVKEAQTATMKQRAKMK
ncbi:hypothetical protein JX266_013226 [Neoarthrinium moseri]|nr:hypothetical protein JX266_013226 [Neoarthrinium moseri]